MIQSLRYGVRSLIRAPLLSAVTILTLAIGIGLNAGVFTVVNGMMFRARIEKDPDSFVQPVSRYSGTYKQPGEIRSFTTTDFDALRTRSQSLTDIAAWRDVHLHFGKEAESTLALVVTCEFFDLYGLSREDRCWYAFRASPSASRTRSARSSSRWTRSNTSLRGRCAPNWTAWRTASG